MGLNQTHKSRTRHTSQAVSELRNILLQQLPLLKKKYHIKSLSLFGSYIRNEQTPESDLDLLISFQDPPGLLKFIELENYLTDCLGVKVDLVIQEVLKPRIGKRILDEVIPV